MARRNKAFDGAERFGREARRAGKPRSANRYGDARTHYGGVTFARAFHTAWRDGWDKEDRAIAIEADNKRLRK